MNRRQFLALSAASAAIGAGCRRGTDPALAALVTTPAAARSQTLLVDAGGRGHFGAYLEELVGVEGLLGVRRIDPSVEAPAVLASVPSAIVYGAGLSPAWIEALDGFVVRGGTLAAVAADAALLARFGVEELGPLPDSYSGVRVAAADAAPLRLHVSGRRWRVPGGATIATFHADDGEGEAGDLPSPAAVTVGRGAGTATCWAFDLARNVAYIRQGDPALVNTERDGEPEIRFVDRMFGWVQSDHLERPDADLFVRALVGELADGAGMASGPLLGLNFFPAGAPSVFVCTGDAHGVGGGVLDQVLRRLENGGAHITVYYEPPETPAWRRYARRARWAATSLPLVGSRLQSEYAPPSPQLVEEWRARGHEFSPHPTAIPDLDEGLERAWEAFAEDGYGSSHASMRTHGVIWKDWVHNPKIQRAYGIRMNLDVYQIGPVMRRSDGTWSHGHLTGSGLPARFVDENGELIDCYQQPTQLVDEQLMANQGGPERLSGAGSAAVGAEQASRALRGAPAVLCGVFHIESFVPVVGRSVEAGAFVDGMMTLFRKAGVPMWPAGRWLRFLDGRRATVVSARTWDRDHRRLTCTLDVGAGTDPGLEVLVPMALGDAVLDRVSLDGHQASLAPVVRVGRRWARISAAPGSRQLVADYRAT
jgi:hypothetical protein